MTNKDYAHLLLDSSFKESERYWTRNNYFLLMEGLLFGFVANIMSKACYQELPVIFL